MADTQPDEENQWGLPKKKEPDISASSSEVSVPEEKTHEFSSPWQNSDVILLIEDQKVHVHRLILQMMSPVLSNFLKETDSNEVPLSMATVSEFVDLLRVIYPQFKNQITLDNIEHIYKLAEEYEVESVIEVCREYLVLVKKTTTNVMKVLVMAQVCKCDEARKQCYDILKKSTVEMLTSDEYFDGLDEISLRNVLVPKAERLEKCLTDIQPQLVGLIDLVLHLWWHDNNKQKMGGMPKRCQEHQQCRKANTSMQTRMKCSVCKTTFRQMATNSLSVSLYGETSYYYSSAGAYLDEDIVNVVQEMFSLLKM